MRAALILLSIVAASTAAALEVEAEAEPLIRRAHPPRIPPKGVKPAAQASPSSTPAKKAASDECRLTKSTSRRRTCLRHDWGCDSVASILWTRRGCSGMFLCKGQRVRCGAGADAGTGHTHMSSNKTRILISTIPDTDSRLNCSCTTLR